MIARVQLDVMLIETVFFLVIFNSFHMRSLRTTIIYEVWMNSKMENIT
jgi:hypothetical protein